MSGSFLIRRDFLKMSAVAAALPAALSVGSIFRSTPASAADLIQNKPLHGISLFNDLKLSADFTNLQYVNPDAPKAGKLSLMMTGTFDSLNGFIIKGSPSLGLDFTFDSLGARAYDEPDAIYGLLC